MFDLFRSKQRGVRYLLTAILSLIALSMVITLIPGFGGPTADTANDAVVAEIGKDVLTMREVQLGLQDTLRGKQIPPELVSVYAPQIINSIVIDRAMSLYAGEIGFNITDADVAQVIQATIPSLWQDGKFVGKEAYEQLLGANNTTIPEFEKKMRVTAGIRRLQSLVLEGMVVTPEEIEREYRSRNEKIALEYVSITQAKVQSEIKITQEDLESTFAVNKAQHRIPEKRAFSMLVVDEEKAGSSLQITDADLKRLYDSNRDSFRTPERVKGRHILIKTQGLPKEEVDKQKQKAEGLLKQVQGGADFAKLAKENSDDTVSKEKGGDLDWFGRGQMVPEFEKEAFSLKPGQTSNLVTTTYGFHILQVTGKEEARMKPFDEVKEDIRKQVEREKLYERLQALGDQAKAMLTKAPDQAEQIAQQLGVHYVKVDAAGNGDPLPIVGVDATDLWDQIFTLKKKGDVSDLVQTPGSKLAVVVLDNVIPSRQAELAEVQDQLRASLLSERARRVLQERSNEILKKIAEAGGDLRKVAAANKLEVKTAPEFGRDGAAEGIGSANYLEEGFARPVGSVFGPVTIGTSTFICKVSAKTPADMSKFSEQRFDTLLRIKGRKAQERKDLFEDGLLEHLKRTGKVKIHQDTVQRLVQSYKNS